MMKTYTILSMAALASILWFGCSAPRNPDSAVAVFTPLEYSGESEADYDPATQYRNPILPGYYPDPSICRNGEDYYLVTSTFGHFPGIPVWHSTDLVHWESCGSALSRNSQLPLGNKPLAFGVFAPQISYNPGNGKYYIINTIVGGHGNFFVTSDDPKTGSWSESILLPQVKGIDPSILFDTDGKAWIVSATSAAEMGEKPLYEDGDNVIPLYEFDWRNDKVVGEPKILVRHGVRPEDKPLNLEGPHLYHIGDTYFLMCAEGGTERGHSEVIFQSKRVDGPYTPCLINPILTQRDLPNGRENMVACTGHADLVQSAAGSWYAVFLGTMPYDGDYAFNTGRQTFLLPVTWTDAQQPIILEQGKPVPLVVDMTDDMKSLVAKNTIEGFDGYRPGPLWDGDGLKDFVLFLRNPVAQGGKSTDAFDLRQSLKKGPFYDIDDKGLLRLACKGVKLSDYANPAFIGERITAKLFSASTTLDFQPSDTTEAGIVCLQNEKQFMTFMKKMDSTGRVYLALDEYRFRSSDRSTLEAFRFALPENTRHFEVTLEGRAAKFPLSLKVEAVTPVDYVFSYATVSGKKVSEYIPVGEALDGYLLSTEEAGGFEGAVVGVYAYNSSPSAAWSR
jgi:alpha-N-arabinofuranosidase